MQTVKNTGIGKSSEYLTVIDDTLTKQMKNTSASQPANDEYHVLSDATLANHTRSSVAKANKQNLNRSNSTLESQPHNLPPENTHSKTDDDKEGYEDIPDHEYDEMDDQQQQITDEHALPPETNPLIKQQKLSFHRIENKPEIGSSEYMAVTQDMLLPPHKRTIK